MRLIFLSLPLLFLFGCTSAPPSVPVAVPAVEQSGLPRGSSYECVRCRRVIAVTATEIPAGEQMSEGVNFISKVSVSDGYPRCGYCGADASSIFSDGSWERP